MDDSSVFHKIFWESLVVFWQFQNILSNKKLLISYLGNSHTSIDGVRSLFTLRIKVDVKMNTAHSVHLNGYINLLRDVEYGKGFKVNLFFL